MTQSDSWLSGQFSTLTLSQAKKRQNDFGHDQYLIADLFEALNTQTRSYRRAYCRLGITLESWRQCVGKNHDTFRLHRWHAIQADTWRFGPGRHLSRGGVELRLWSSKAHGVPRLFRFRADDFRKVSPSLVTAGFLTTHQGFTAIETSRAPTPHGIMIKVCSCLQRSEDVEIGVDSAGARSWMFLQEHWVVGLQIHAL